jgi:hypothetical protein
MIYGWDKLKSVPHQLQHLTALKELHIYEFKGEGFEEGLHLSENCRKENDSEWSKISHIPTIHIEGARVQV